MYETEIDGGNSPARDCKLAVVEFKQLDWGSPVLESLLSGHEDERTRNAILV